MVIRLIEHRANKVIQARIDAGKNGGGGCFHHVRFHQEVPSFADKKLAGLKHQLKVAAVRFAELAEARTELFTKVFDIGSNAAFFIGHLETGAKVEVVQIGEVTGGRE